MYNWVLAALLSCVAASAPAEVQVTRFDPPLTINAFADVPDGLLLNVMAVDFNVDGEVDYRLAYGYGSMSAFYNSPTRYARKAPRSANAIGGLVAAVPLCSIIGNNIVSSSGTNQYTWTPGYTNRYDLTQLLGDHEATVIIANVSPTILPYPVIFISTNATLVTNIYHAVPVVSGDVAGKEAVMALEFYINGQLHYGYVHFDFRSASGTPFGGAGGLIHGWAYETEPGVPINALPLSRDRDDRRDHEGRNDQGNRGRDRNRR